MTFIEIAIAFALAITLGTLAEYLIHRYIAHARRIRWFNQLFIRIHAEHHRSNTPDTLWGDYKDFLLGALPIFWLGFLYHWKIGLVFAAFSLSFPFVVALVSNWSHYHPQRIFWMKEPIHAVHHRLDLPGASQVNFGITTTLWDRLFGTFKTQKALQDEAGPASIQANT